MSRTLQAALIFLVLIAAFYFAVCSVNELCDLLWKITHRTLARLY